MHMAKCRNCGSKVETEEVYCPTCGIANPVKVKKNKTVDLTTTVDIVEPNYNLYIQKSRVKAFLFFALVGWTGAGYFYLAAKKRGLMWLLLNVLVIAALTLLAFVIPTPPLGWPIFLLLAFAVMYVVNIVIGLVYLLSPDMKDGHEEFLK